MVAKNLRNEVWNRNKCYMKHESCTKDLRPICEMCESWSIDNNPEEWCENRENCPVFQLWLSNEYLEWAMDSPNY